MHAWGAEDANSNFGFMDFGTFAKSVIKCNLPISPKQKNEHRNPDNPTQTANTKIQIGKICPAPRLKGLQSGIAKDPAPK